MIKIEQSHILAGFLYAFLGTALFSLKSIFIKLAYEQGLNTDSVLMLRMAVSLPIYLLIILYLIIKNNAPRETTKKDFYLILFLGFIGYFLASWLDLKGLEYITAGLERLTLFSYPIFVAILGALFFKTPIDKRISITLVLTYLGLWIIFNQETLISTDKASTGVFFVILSAVSYSFYVLLALRAFIWASHILSSDSHLVSAWRMIVFRCLEIKANQSSLISPFS